MSFQGNIVWITGASSGIGEAVGYEFAKEGAKLVLSARRSDALQAVCAKCMKLGASDAYVLPFDLADLDSLPSKVDDVRARFSRIDILVNNGGIGQRGYVVDTDIRVQQPNISENALMPDGSPRGGSSDREHRNAMTPEASAKQILYAIRTGKEEYDYGGPEKWAITIRRFIPWLYSRSIRKIRLSS